ncbi:hypothetical protein BDV97DRAFT_192794 [Delphinella strobiligena]|nr:hypothetical protein BDV97DRAFT_192794 [Delphinella strobiligena]
MPILIISTLINLALPIDIAILPCNLRLSYEDFSTSTFALAPAPFDSHAGRYHISLSTHTPAKFTARLEKSTISSIRLWSSDQRIDM